MSKKHAANGRLNCTQASIVTAVLAGATSILFTVAVSAADLQLSNSGQDKSPAMTIIQPKMEMTAAVNTSEGTDSAEHWEDPCGGPIVDRVAKTS